MLINLASKQHLVFYVCPRFHLISDLNRYFISFCTSTESAYIRPLDIGELPDQEEHYIAFEPSSNFGYLYSDEPVRSVKIGLDSFVERLRDFVSRAGAEDGTRSAFEAMYRDMLSVIEEFEGKGTPLNNFRKLVDHPLRAAAYLARLYFESELFIVGENRQIVQRQ